MLQTTNKVLFRTNSRLYNDFDVFKIEINYKKDDKKESIRKLLKDLIFNIVVIYNESSSVHYVLTNKNTISTQDLSKTLSCVPAKVTQDYHQTNPVHQIVEINLILLLLTSSNAANGMPVVNYHYDYILGFEKDMVKCMYCRFKYRENVGSYLDFGTHRLIKLSKVDTKTDAELSEMFSIDEKEAEKKQNQKYAQGPFFIIGGKTLKEIINPEDFDRDDVYVKRSSRFSKSVYPKYIIPKTGQYDEDVFYNASLFGVLANEIYRPFSKSAYFDFFKFDTENLNILPNNYTKNADAILKQSVNEASINIVCETETEAVKERINKATNGSSIKMEFSNHVKVGLNIIILDENKSKKNNKNASDIFYEQTTCDFEKGIITQHLTFHKIKKEAIEACIENLLIKEALYKKDISNIFNNSETLTFYLTTRKPVKSGDPIIRYHSIQISGNKITNIILNKTDIFAFDDANMFGEIINNRQYSVKDENGDKLFIYDTNICATPLFDDFINEADELCENDKLVLPVYDFYDCLIEFLDNTNNKKLKEAINQLLILHPEFNYGNDNDITVSQIKDLADAHNPTLRKAISEACKGLQINKLYSQWKSTAFKHQVYPAFDNILYNESMYSVGSKSALNTVANNILFREYHYEGNENIIDKIMPFICVSFVRHGQYTCYPFPFKLLREAILLEAPDIL